MQVISEAIRSGKLGDITAVTLQTFRNTHAKGVQEWKTDWRREQKYSGGGIAMDHGSHTFILHLIGLKLSPYRSQQKPCALMRAFPPRRQSHCCFDFC